MFPKATLSYTDAGGGSQIVRIDRPVFTIGRLRTNDLQINNSYISRLHAEIVFQNGGFHLRDKNSTGGCLINGKRVAEQELADGDLIQLGNADAIVLRFELHQNESDPYIFQTTGESNVADKAVTIISRNQTRFLNTSLLDSAEYITDATLNLLKSFNEVTHQMLSARTVQELLEILLDAAVTSLNADRGAVLMDHRRDGRLETTAVLNRLDDGNPVRPSQTIVEQAFTNNVAIKSFDAMEDNRFSLNSSIILQEIHSVLCAPIGSSNRVWGVCYLDNTHSRARFTDEDLEYFLALTQQAGLTLDNLTLIEELRSAQEKIINQAKLATLGQFASGIAHELKNQLTTLTAAELLMAVTEDQKLRKLLQVILNAQQRMLTMVNEIRDFSKPQANPFQKDLQPFIPIVEEAVSLSRFDQTVKICRIEHVFDFKAEMYLNRDKITQVIINLVRNAGQSMPKGGRIKVTLSEENHRAVLRVIDHGIGIPADLLPRIWEPFFTTKGSEGTGLGLGICKRIVEGHGGTIQCESTAGVGTTFTVTLPVPGLP